MTYTEDDLIPMLDRYEEEFYMRYNQRERKLLVSFAEWLLPQLLNKGSVIGWQEFEKQKPNIGDEVIVKSKKTGRKQIWEISAERLKESYLPAYSWCYPPA